MTRGMARGQEGLHVRGNAVNLVQQHHPPLPPKRINTNIQPGIIAVTYFGQSDGMPSQRVYPDAPGRTICLRRNTGLGNSAVIRSTDKRTYRSVEKGRLPQAVCKSAALTNSRIQWYPAQERDPHFFRHCLTTTSRGGEDLRLVLLAASGGCWGVGSMRELRHERGAWRGCCIVISLVAIRQISANT